MTRRVHLALILTASTTAGCATAAPSLAIDSGHRAPVGARLVPQPIMPNDPSLRLDLSAYYVNEPAQIDARMRVQPDARSRSLTIEWWTEDGVGGSHLISLDGDQSAATFRYPISRMTEGEYMVTAVLQRNDGSTVRLQRRVLVIGEHGVPGPPGIADEPIW